MDIPFSPAAERNKEPILKIKSCKKVIGPQHKRLFGNWLRHRQHAVYLAPFFPHLQWTPTERAENLPALQRRVQESKVANLRHAGEFDVARDDIAL